MSRDILKVHGLLDQNKYAIYTLINDFGGILVTQTVKNLCEHGDLGLIPGLGRPLEKGMATHSSIFAWRIPWTEEPGRLQSIGSQRVKHN